MAPHAAATDAAGLRARVPAPVRALLEALRSDGHEAFLVGGCVRDWLRGAPVHDFDVATSAPAEAVLSRFPRAVPIGLRHGTVMVPTAAGPVDVTRYRGGGTLADDLAHRDFTVNAMALGPGGTLHDPFSGLKDLRRGRLRAVGDAADRLGEDPLRALRAARLVAALGLEADPVLAQALRGIRRRIGDVARERVRGELEALLEAEEVAPGIGLLRATGLEEALLSGARPDAAAVVGALPADTGLRLAAWLRGVRSPNGLLARLRFPRRLAQRVLLLLRFHPVDAVADPESEGSVRRLLQRTAPEPLASWLLLRRAELAAPGDAAPDGATADEAAARDAAEARLRRLESTVARVRASGELALHRLDLALDGREVMRALGCGPGPHVGRALRYLTERVLGDPALNTPERLRALLQERAGPPTAGGPGGGPVGGGGRSR